MSTSSCGRRYEGRRCEGWLSILEAAAASGGDLQDRERNAYSGEMRREIERERERKRREKRRRGAAPRRARGAGAKRVKTKGVARREKETRQRYRRF